MIAGLSLDVICITQSWLIDYNEISPVGYKFYRRERSTRGGSVAILISGDIPSQLICRHESLELI